MNLYFKETLSFPSSRKLITSLKATAAPRTRVSVSDRHERVTPPSTLDTIGDGAKDQAGGQHRRILD